MTPLTANLKLIWFKPILFIYLVIFPLPITALTMPHIDKLITVTLMAWIILLASIVAGRFMEVLTSTTSFMLPGQIKTVKNITFVTGIIATLIFTAVHIIVVGKADTNGYIGLLTIPALLWGSFLTAILVTFRTYLPLISLIGFAALVPLVITPEFALTFNHKIFYQLHYLIILYSLYITFRTWHYLNNNDCIRTLHQRFSKEAIKNGYKKFLDDMKISKAVELFLMQKLRNARPGSTMHYYWGSLYSTWTNGLSESYSKQFWTLMSISLVIIGYVGGPDKAMPNSLLLLPVISASVCNMDIFSNGPIVKGRKMRFHTAYMILFTHLLVITMFTIAFCLISHSLSAVLPAIPFNGKTYTYTSISNYKLLPITFLLTPVFALLNLWQSNKNITYVIINFILTIFLITKFKLPFELGYSEFLICIISGFILWLIFLLYLRHICFKGTLFNNKINTPFKKDSFIRINR